MIIRVENNTSVLDFNQFESYEDFDKILSGLLWKFDFELGDKIDGPESRLYELKLAETNFLLINNPYGNLLRPLDENGEQLLPQIAIRLELYFSHE